MEIRTFGDLIDWTRKLHGHLAACLKHCSSDHSAERVRLLLDYLAEHESQLEHIVAEFERQAPAQALRTYVYDFLEHKPIKAHEDCERPFADLDERAVVGLVMDYHEQVMTLYKALLGRAEIPETRDLVRSLLEMEEHEAMRLARQTQRMEEL